MLKRQHFHVSYYNAAWRTIQFRTFDEAEAEAKLVELESIAPLLAYDSGTKSKKFVWLTPCSNVKHEHLIGEAK